MKSLPEDRCQEVGKYILANHATMRQAAKKFNVGRNTIFVDVSQRLKSCNSRLYHEVAKVIAENKAERHIRGGQATKEKLQAAKAKLKK